MKYAIILLSLIFAVLLSGCLSSPNQEIAADESIEQTNDKLIEEPIEESIE